MAVIGVISDTHGALTKKNIHGLFHDGSGIITLGDISNEELKIIKKSYRFLGGVRGNCDSDSSLPHSKTIEIDGIRIFLSHKPVRIRLTSRVEDRRHGYDVALFGHLHKRFHGERDGIDYFSPGSFSLSRDHYGPSAGIIEIFSRKRCKFRYVDVVL